MQTPQTLNITVGTDVILNVYLEHEGDAITPSLIDDLQANLITGLGKKTPMEANITADYVVVNIPWVDGRLPGCYSLELTGSINNLAWSAVGKSIIRYTSATETGRSTVVVTGDSYDVTMEVGYYYTDSPIEQVQVTVDDQVGEPYAVSSYVKKKLRMDFHNMKGETGKEGPQGKQGIPGTGAIWTGQGEEIMELEQTHGTAINKAMSQAAVTDELVAEWRSKTTAPYSQNYFIGGTPVQWRAGEAATNTCKMYTVSPGDIFRFTKRGENSYHVVFLTTDVIDLQNPAPQYAGGVSSVEWQSEDAELVAPADAAFMYVREYVREYINNSYVVTNKFPLNIEDGIPVKVKVPEIEEKSSSPSDNVYDSTPLNLAEYDNSSFYINGDGVWKKSSNANNASKMIGIKPGTRYIVSNGDGNSSHHVVFLQDDTTTANTRPHYAGGNNDMRLWSGTTDILEAPADANVMYIRVASSGSNVAPVVKMVETFGDKIVDVDRKAESNVTTYDDVTVVLKYISGGVWKNSDNYNNSCKFIPISPGMTYKLEKRNGSYHAFFLQDDYQEVGYTPHYVDGVTAMPAWTSGTQYLVAPADAKYLYVRYMTSSVDKSPYVTEFANGDETLDTIADERPVARQAARVVPGNRPALTLMHYSDIHGDNIAAKAILDYIRLYSGVINDSLVTGDVVHFRVGNSTQYPNGTAWWQGCGLAAKSLFVLGNHDGSVSSGYLDDYGQENDFDSYIAPYAENLGIILPEGYDDSESPYYKACYWHKDYPDQKIRLIGLDCIHRFDGVVDPTTGQQISVGLFYLTTAMEEWLVARLNETLAGSGDAAEGYSVVTCGHYPLDEFDDTNRENMVWDDTTHKWVCNQGANGGRVMDGRTASLCNWHYAGVIAIDQDKKYNWRNRTGTTSNWTKGNVNNVGNILQSFIDGGGNIIAHLCGHHHCDLMFYPERYPTILNIAINQAGFLRDGSQADKTLGAPRTTANIVSFDTYNGLIKIARLGQKVDRLMTPQNALCYDYINKKVISEW